VVAGKRVDEYSCGRERQKSEKERVAIRQNGSEGWNVGRFERWGEMTEGARHRWGRTYGPGEAGTKPPYSIIA